MNTTSKPLRQLLLILTCGAVAAFLSGCASDDDLKDPGYSDAGYSDSGTGFEGAGDGAPVPLERETFGVDNFDPDKNLDKETLRAYNVQFGYDSYTIAPSERSKLDAVAKYMQENPEVNIYILGHTDERGTAEYNRALGERRANACRDYLIGLGIAGKRIGTMSFGFERPLDPAHNEAAWAKNRRAEFGIVKK